MTDRIANFSAGPGALPESVLQQAQQDLWDIAGSGIGILEHSHRGKVFGQVIEEAEATCRRVAGVPDNYRVLFLQGGASTQFAMVPMNLRPEGATADYIVTGTWAKKAYEEAALLGSAHLVATGKESNFSELPAPGDLKYSADPAYVHFTTNNTIFGTQFSGEPAVPGAAPLIADASSDIFSRPIDIERYGMIYAGAQKNLGPSGIALIIIRDDLVERSPGTIPTMLRYRTHAEEKSLYNTPPTFGIYMVGKVLKWIEDNGGLTAMEQRNREKAGLLYRTIDGGEFYRGTAKVSDRSQMNVCFRTPNEELDGMFVKQATARGMDGLKGHRSVGGMRASVYNACRREWVVSLVDFMREFERDNG